MALHLITGFAGYEHIKSSDQGAYNIATFGSGNFVFNRGSEFFATVTSNNTINIADGEAMLQGRFIKAETSEDVTIENGTQGKTRQDLICIRYEKSASDGTESASLVVIKGAENGGDPAYNNGNITDGTDSVADFPLYRVKLNGITIESVTALFEVKVSMKEYMESYQMPAADKEHLGGIIVGASLSADKTGKLQVQYGSGLGRDSNGYIYNPKPYEITENYSTWMMATGDYSVPAKGSKQVTYKLETSPQYNRMISFIALRLAFIMDYTSRKELVYYIDDCIYNICSIAQDSTGFLITLNIYNPTESTKSASGIIVKYMYSPKQ